MPKLDEKPASAPDVDEFVVHPWQGEWKVDLSAWTTMEPLMQWQEQARRSDFTAMSETMAGVIRQWPYDLPPGDAASYRKISPAQWKQAAEQVGRAVGNFFQSADA